jgi:hypothetical protein
MKLNFSSSRIQRGRAVLLASLLIAPVACGGSAQKPAEGASTTSVTPPPPASVTPSAAPAPSAAEPAAVASPAPTAEKKNAEEAPPTPEDYAAAAAAAKTEAERFTPELRAKVAELEAASHPSLKAALSAVLASPHRKPGAVDRDKYRHPLETLEFLGITPKSTVLEYGPGEGWYT